jgi:hypothetical protein
MGGGLLLFFGNNPMQPMFAGKRKLISQRLSFASLLETATMKSAKLVKAEVQMSSVDNSKGLAVVAGAVLFSGVALAQSPPDAQMSSSVPAIDALIGRWARTEGPYIISINAVVNGKLDASYFNPRPLPFQTAEVTRDGNTLNLFFKLSAGGYGGSTYTLKYDAETDSLRGVYNQVVVLQKFDVIFKRIK